MATLSQGVAGVQQHSILGEVGAAKEDDFCGRVCAALRAELRIHHDGLLASLDMRFRSPNGRRSLPPKDLHGAHGEESGRSKCLSSLGTNGLDAAPPRSSVVQIDAANAQVRNFIDNTDTTDSDSPNEETSETKSQTEASQPSHPLPSNGASSPSPNSSNMVCDTVPPMSDFEQRFKEAEYAITSEMLGRGSSPTDSVDSQIAPLKSRVNNRFSTVKSSIFPSNKKSKKGLVFITPQSVFDVGIKGYLQKIVRSRSFDSFCGIVIIFNAALIGIETDYLTQHYDNDPLLVGIQQALNYFYLIELMLRLFADGKEFVFGPDRNWNLFDAVLLSTSVLEIITEGFGSVGRSLRTLRLLRMTRTLRLARSLRYIREFRKMAYAMGSSAPTLLWSLVLLLFILYTFAVLFVQGISEHFWEIKLMDDVMELRGDNLELFLVLHPYYGDVPAALFTLYCSITAGISWREAALPLLAMGSMGRVYIGVFIVFMSVCIFGVVNIITSVFVESAMQSARHSKDLMIQEKARDKEMYMTHLKRIFREMDADQSGSLSENEIIAFVNSTDNDVQFYLEALEINANDARALFRLIDTDGSGVIDYDEFVEGCLNLKGDASSYDVNCLMYEMRRMQKWWKQLMQQMDEQDKSILRTTHALKDVKKTIRKTQAYHASSMDWADDGQVPRASGRSRRGSDDSFIASKSTRKSSVESDMRFASDKRVMLQELGASQSDCRGRGVTQDVSQAGHEDCELAAAALSSFISSGLEQTEEAVPLAQFIVGGVPSDKLDNLVVAM